MDVKEETGIALKDAYWAEVRKLYEAYLHSVSIAQENDPPHDAAAERFKKGLIQARTALDRCLELAGEAFKF